MRILKRLDTTDLSIEQTKKYDGMFISITDSYTAFVDELSVGKEDDVYWWTNVFASRNPLISFARQDIAMVMFIMEEIESKGGYDEIIVQNKPVYKVLRRELQKRGLKTKIVLNKSRSSAKTSIKEKLSPFIFIFRELKTRSIILQNHTKYRAEEKGMVLLQTDVFSSCFSSGKYIARDFYNIEAFTDKTIGIIPYFFVNNDWSKERLVLECCRENHHIFVFREEYLKAVDYLWVAVAYFRYELLCAGKKQYRGIDVTEIINADIRRSKYGINSFYGILDNSFFRRLSKEKVEVDSFIGWYEGQPSSIGAFRAFRMFYKGKKNIGYSPFPIDVRQCQYSISKEQVRQCVSPEEIGLLNSDFEGIVKRYSDITVKYVPSFRMQGYFEKKRYKATKDVLITLSYDIASSAGILDAFSKAKFIREISLVIKNHPANDHCSLTDYGISDFRYEYSFFSGGYSEAMEMADIIVISNSTAGYETVLSGKYLIYFAKKGEINYTFLPKEYEGEKYTVVYSAEELENVMNCWLDRPLDCNERKSIITDKLIPTSYHSVAQLLA